MAVLENDLIVGPLVPAAGVTTISLDFYFEDKTWLQVFKSNSEAPLVLDVDYTVAGEGSDNGVVTLTTPANGIDAYSVFLVVPLQRSSDMQLRGEFKSGPFNIELDRLWQALQGLRARLGRVLVVSRTSVAPTALFSESTGARADCVLKFTADGLGLEIGPAAGELASAQGYAEIASEKAEEAADSAAAAASYAADSAAAAAAAAGQPLANRATAEAATVPDQVVRIAVIAPNGSVLDYVYDADGTALSTNGGARTWSPAGDASSDHWGFAKDGTDETTLIESAIDWCAANAVPLDFAPGTYGFTNIAATGNGYHYNITAKRGGASFQQVAARDPDQMCLNIGGGDVIDTRLDVDRSKGERTVTLDSTAGAEKGDLILLKSSRLLEGDHRFDPNRVYSQLCKIRQVLTGSTGVILEEMLAFDFAATPITTGTAQAGASGQITLSASETVLEHDIKGYLLRITGGTGNGQERYIHEYDPSTKVVDIGTSYTTNPQNDWTINPDATSTYEIVGITTAKIIRPATGSVKDLHFIGYEENGVIVRGGYVRRVDHFLVENMHFEGFSNHGLYTAYSYKGTVNRCLFERANYGEPSGHGLGYGHLDTEGYRNFVHNCIAKGCRTGFDTGNTTLFLTRDSNHVEGGGVTYSGSNYFFPMGNKTGVPHSGFSTHTGAYATVDRNNTTHHVARNKIRAQEYVVDGHRAFGSGGDADGIFEISYSPSARVLNSSYDDMFSAASNRTLDGDDVVGAPATQERPRAFVRVRHGTMPKSSTVDVIGNQAKSVSTSLVYLQDAGDAEGMYLTVCNNRFSVLSEAAQVLSVIKSSSTNPALRGLRAYGNDFDPSGSVLGSIFTDNGFPYPILDDMNYNQIAYQVGPSTWAIPLDDDDACEVPMMMGFTRAVLHVYEKDNKVANHFYGIVNFGSSTAVATISNSGQTLRTSLLSGTTGTNGELSVSLRAEGRPMVENRTGTAGVFVFDVRKPF